MEIKRVLPKQIQMSANPSECYLSRITSWIRTDGDNYALYNYVLSWTLFEGAYSSHWNWASTVFTVVSKSPQPPPEEQNWADADMAAAKANKQG